MASNIPFFRGKDCLLKFYQDGKAVYFAGKNWTIEENATEANDGVNGENRDRLDKVTNYYSLTVDMYQQDMVQIESILAAQKPDDDSLLPLKQTAALFVKMRDGTKAVYLLKGVKAGPFSWSFGGRAENVMLNYKFRFQYMENAQSAL